MPVKKEMRDLACSDRVVSLRRGVEADLSAILAIERVSFSSPWTERSFRQELRNPRARLLVAEQDGRVIGYLCRWLIVDEVEILNVAVHPNLRQRGVATLLLHETLREARHNGASSVYLEVQRSNLSALALYRQFGFCAVSIRRRYYHNGEDAVLMVCSLREKVLEESGEKQ